jgi:hypothetical protein
MDIFMTHDQFDLLAAIIVALAFLGCIYLEPGILEPWYALALHLGFA